VDIIKSAVTGASHMAKFLSAEKNLGFVKNLQRGLAMCSGEYVAIMEGDDYWTDPLRINKHLEFLNTHAECTLSMNRFAILDEVNNQYSFAEWNSADDFKYVNTQQMAGGNKLGNMSACVFRKDSLEKIKPELFSFEISDWMLGMVLSEHGPIAILKDVMSVYRIHNGGLWSKMSATEKNEYVIKLIDQYNQYLEGRYSAPFAQYKQSLVQDQARSGQRLREFVPPILIHVVKLLVPPVILKSLRR